MQRQIEQLNCFIEMKVDLIVLTAADPEAVRPVVARARAAGIRVVAVDVVAGGVDATVMTDNLDAGRKACTFIAERLRGRGSMVIVNGPHLSSVIDRVRGCVEVLKQYPQIRVLSSDRDAGGSSPGGFAAMTELLAKYPHLDAVFAINDPTALGAERAAVQAARKEFLIVSVDGSPRVVARMREPDSLIAASMGQRPSLQAQKAVETAAGLPAGGSASAPTILIPTYVVTGKDDRMAGGCLAGMIWRRCCARWSASIRPPAPEGGRCIAPSRRCSAMVRCVEVPEHPGIGSAATRHGTGSPRSDRCASQASLSWTSTSGCASRATGSARRRSGTHSARSANASAPVVLAADLHRA